MYLDTSVAVKLFIPEPDSDECELIAGNDGFLSSELLFGEMYAAMLAKEHSGHISRAAREKIWDRFENLMADNTVHLIKLDGMVVREAVEVMAQVHPDVPLRTLDAIHLATYLSVDAGPLFTKDRRMIEAAKKLNIPLAGV
jgi:predicted nucleic acid-binding protein